MKTNYLSAPVTALNPSLVTIAAWDSRSPAISQKETKRTKVRGVGFAFLLAAFLGSCVTTELRAQVIVVPNALGHERWQCFWHHTFRPHVSALACRFSMPLSLELSPGHPSSPNSPGVPTQILGQSGPRSVTLRIYASTTSRSVAGLSTTFAENLGTNNTLVFDGTLTWTTANLPGPGNTRQFDIVFPLTTPFLYDPAAGNLLLDIQLSAERLSNHPRYECREDPRARSRRSGLFNRCHRPSVRSSFFQVTQFTFVPKPTVAVSFLFGLGLLITKRQRPGFSPNALQK